MLMLKILGVISSIALIAFIIYKIWAYIADEYGYNIFDWKILVAVIAAYGIYAITYIFIKSYEKVTPLDFQVLAGLVIISAFILLIYNIKKTNFILGIVSTIIQLTIGLLSIVIILLAVHLATGFKQEQEQKRIN